MCAPSVASILSHRPSPARGPLLITHSSKNSLRRQRDRTAAFDGRWIGGHALSCSVRDTRRLWRHGSGTPRYCFRVGNKSNGFGANPASPRARQHPPSAGAAPPLLSTARAQPVPTSCAHRAGPSGPPSPASRPDGGLDEIDACGGGGEAGANDWGAGGPSIFRHTPLRYLRR